MKRARDERGESLIELLITVSIVGIAVVTIVLAMATALTASDAHKKQATVERLLRDNAQNVSNPTGYSATCGPNYSSQLATDPGFVVTITQVRYWDGVAGSAPSTTCPSSDNGIQWITLRAASNDGRASSSLVVVRRAP